MLSDFFTEHLAASPVVAILRGYSVTETVNLAIQCWESGIRLVEVPIQSEAALEALASVAAHANTTDRLIGAGTVCSPAQVASADEAGARFVVAPGLFPDAVRAADAAGLPTLPGVMTPTESYRALELSLPVQKLFPASAHGPSGLRTLHGPFPEAQFVAVGGVNADTAQSYLDAGAAGVGIASALNPQSLGRLCALSPHP
ncbi:bifunctional 4-hydroxy-2-oxoglutarate aldolase/2-dehydro-3-deoxy-phosphogluconate aldolase [Microbacterium aurantiacum]|uniref:bifunctional 4-hydroxy-2-oxoglutarate aldolase/2-dehydro-3-deoxy-phosphogluconate aldolase n=1 Tax=Microbacterium aurantiacum TaxID=162393 RepID=UPI00341A0D05